MTQQVAVTVRILDKEFQIGCPVNERKALEASAEYLNEQMRTVKESGVVGADRIAILAALNITRELLNSENTSNDYQTLSGELSELSQHISTVLEHINA